MPLSLPGGKKASESRAFLGPFALQNCLRILRHLTFISEQPDPNLRDLFDTRSHGSQRLSASYEHTRHVVVTRTHAHPTRDKGTKALTVPRRPPVRPNTHTLDRADGDIPAKSRYAVRQATCIR